MSSALFIALLSEPALRSTLIEHALSDDYTDRYFGLVTKQITPDDIAQLGLAVHPDMYSTVAIEALLQHERREIRSAMAAALLAAGDLDDRLVTPTLRPIWRSAIEELDIPLPFRLDSERDLFARLVSTAPDIYETLLIRAAKRAPGEGFYPAVEGFGDSAYSLPQQAKSRIFRARHPDSSASYLFRFLSGNDVEWIEQLLDTKEVDADFIVSTVSGLGPAVPIDDLAKILVPRGVNPLLIAVTTELGTQWGEEHERIAHYLEKMTVLAASADASIAAVGRAGVGLYGPKLEAAEKRYRHNMIRGRL